MMDSDWLTAKELQIPVVEVAPFSPVTPEASQANLEMMAGADVIILGNIPFGSGNRKNLLAAVNALESGKQVVICDFTPIDTRDFTGGLAGEVYERLKNMGAGWVCNSQELIELLKNIAQRNRVGIVSNT
jgi:iron complex transport system ATP-binding protein